MLWISATNSIAIIQKAESLNINRFEAKIQKTSTFDLAQRSIVRGQPHMIASDQIGSYANYVRIQ